MDELSNLMIPLFLLFLTTIFLIHRSQKFGHRFPPGPSGWPIIGNLFDLDRTMPHRTLNDMREKYGDVIGLRLGAINTMVILSAKSATELFKNHDLTFADRSLIESTRICGFNEGALSLLPYGSHWRVLRKLITADMLSNKKLNETAFMRRKCVDDLLNWIEEESSNNNGIKIAHILFNMSFNLMGNLVLSRDLFDLKMKQGSEFMKALMRVMELTGKARVVDFFPWLKWLGIEGGRREMEEVLGEAMEIANKYVKERVEEKKEKMGNRSKDFLDVLLEFEGNGKDGPHKISDHTMKVFILEMFIALAENASSSIEWALAELLRNPEKMKKAKAELSSVIGPTRKVEETDIDNLPYLQAILKETLRVYTPAPFLVPRKATQDVDFMGYQIPKNTQVLVNAWAIARDPQVWEDPLCFKPERFIGSEVDYKGQNFEYIPFGAGRRLCVGLSLSHRVINLMLGSLLHQFDWELDPNVDPSAMDMKEILGVTMRKLEPLLVFPKKIKT